MYRFVVAAVVLAAWALPALAADVSAQLYTKAPAALAAPLYSWTGCYLGVNVGAGFARKDNTDAFANPSQSLGGHDANSLVGGGQAGCDYQTGQFVVGLRGQVSGSAMQGRNAVPQNAAVAYNTHVSAFETATVRAGVLASPATLIYVQGGGAWTQERHQQMLAPSTVTFSENQTWGGWTVGAGLEYMIGQRWSVFGEYNYLNFGTSRSCFVTGSCPGLGVNNAGGVVQKLGISTATVGVNYRLGWGQ